MNAHVKIVTPHDRTMSILRKIAWRNRTTLKSMLSSSKSRIDVAARTEAVAFLIDEMGMTQGRAARVLNRDRSSIAIAYYRAQYKRNPSSAGGISYVKRLAQARLWLRKNGGRQTNA